MRALLLLLTICIIINPYCLSASNGTNKMEDYAQSLLPDNSVRVLCPPVDHSLFSADPDMRLAMEALKTWYCAEEERSALLSSGYFALIVNPFIFKIETTRASKKISCVCNFDEFWMYEDSNHEFFLSQGYHFYQAFNIEYALESGKWKAIDISIPGIGEELFPGGGIGTQGMNGVSDQMIQTMSKEGYTGFSEEYANIYLNANGFHGASVIFEGY